MGKKGDVVIRVYGIVIENNKILLTDEFQLGMKMTKFPGGGLKYGEGLKECIIREFKEECNHQEIYNIRHFYTTDFYQKALFYENAQLISIYFRVSLKYPLQFKISSKAFDFEKLDNGNQSFRWVKLKDVMEDDITFPIDKLVIRKLKKQAN